VLSDVAVRRPFDPAVVIQTDCMITTYQNVHYFMITTYQNVYYEYFMITIHQNVHYFMITTHQNVHYFMTTILTRTSTTSTS